ncbi:MAG: bifunctional phosphoribosyl-AMP cyclohydrolase/phosphoribosyl-ATP diphosphatase [Opitutus sp.]|nr:bifunctional phosphoribosyl-AMP cyclohydrolase/phosphoribosyl-ATP diphosphatase [Opitutus sp.]
MNSLPTLDWQKGGGLLPAIVQDADTQQVLMLGYMNAAALEQTLATKRVTFFSRAKSRPWVKGETSGHYLDLVNVEADCDADALLVRARPNGPTCHRGTCSCFGEGGASGVGFLAELERLVTQRIASGDEKSYTAKLVREGVRRVAQKVGEEGVETALAATAGDHAELAGEAADLLYHLIVLLRAKGLTLGDALAVLEKRHAAKK